MGKPATVGKGEDWTVAAERISEIEGDDDVSAQLSIRVAPTNPEYESITAYLDGCSVLCTLPSRVAVEQFNRPDFVLKHFGLGAGAAEAIGAARTPRKGFV